MPNYKNLHEIFDGTKATGESSFTVEQMIDSQLQILQPTPPIQTLSRSSEIDNAVDSSDDLAIENTISDQPSTTTSRTYTKRSRSDGTKSGSSNRNKRQRQSGVGILAGKIDEMLEKQEKHHEERMMAKRKDSKAAIKLLCEYYENKLTTHEMVLAMELLEDERKAGIFLEVKEGSIRDAWLERQIEKQE